MIDEFHKAVAEDLEKHEKHLDHLQEGVTSAVELSLVNNTALLELSNRLNALEDTLSAFQEAFEELGVEFVSPPKEEMN